MKKPITKLMVILAICGMSSTAFATVAITQTTTIGGASNTFTPSAKVGISAASIATSYVATSCHVNGTFQYGTLGGTGLTANTYSDPSKIYQSDIPSQSGKTIGEPTAVDAAALALPSVTWK